MPDAVLVGPGGDGEGAVRPLSVAVPNGVKSKLWMDELAPGVHRCAVQEHGDSRQCVARSAHVFCVCVLSLTGTRCSNNNMQTKASDIDCISKNKYFP